MTAKTHGPIGAATSRTLSAAQPLIQQETAAARLGSTDAARIVAAQYAAGLDLDAIAAHSDNLTAGLLADAQTTFGTAYAREFGDTTAALVADLRQDAAIALGRSAAACTLADGTPHPDPALAAKGWQVDHGIYQRTCQHLADREAC